MPSAAIQPCLATTRCEIDMGGTTPIDPTYWGEAIVPMCQCGRCAIPVRVGWDG